MTELNRAPDSTAEHMERPDLPGGGTGSGQAGALLVSDLALAGLEDGDYEYDQEAEPKLLDVLFADMGVPDGLVRPARTWARRQIGYQKELCRDVYSMGALQRDLWFWLGGYEQALVDLGLREPDNRNTFRS
jgi:hypothetical protein